MYNCLRILSRMGHLCILIVYAHKNIMFLRGGNIMKQFKKPLAVILAVLVVIGSISLAFAIKYPYDNTELNLKSSVAYYRDSTDVTNTNIEPGGTLTAKVSFTTDFVLIPDFQIVYLYDKNVFTLAPTPVETDVTASTPVKLIAGGLHLKYRSGDNLNDGTVAATSISSHVSDDIKSNYGYIEIIAEPVDSDTARKFAGEEVFSIDFTVKSAAEIANASKNRYVLAPAALAQDFSHSDGTYLSTAEVVIDEDLLTDFSVDANAGTVSYSQIYDYGPDYYDASAVFKAYNIRNLLTTDSSEHTDEGGNFVNFEGKARFDAAIASGVTLKGNTNGIYDATGVITASVADADVPKAADIGGTTDYEFVGWSTAKVTAPVDQGGTKYYYGDITKQTTTYTYGDFTTTPDEVDNTYYAIFKAADTQYKVEVYTYDLNADGTQATTSTQIDAGTWTNGTVGDVKKVSDVYTTVPAGYEIANPDDSITLDVLSQKDNNILKVYLNRKAYEVNWVVNKNGTDESAADPQNVLFGAPLSALTDPVLDMAGKYYGYTESGWPDHSTGTMPAETVTYKNNLTPKDIPVNFDLGEGTGTAPTASPAKYDAAIGAVTEGNVTPPGGKLLEGWTYTKPDGTTSDPIDTAAIAALVANKDVFQTPVESGITFTAKYKDKADGTIRYYKDENKTPENLLAEIPGYEGEDVPAGSTPANPADTIDKKFVGWSEPLPATFPGAPLDIVGIWEDVAKVTVTYKFADGSADQTFTDYPTTPYTAPANSIIDGYTTAWSETLTAIPNADTTVTETKTPKDVTFTFDPDNGSDPTTETVKYDSAVPKPSDPSKPNTDFDGWYFPDGVTKYDFDKTPEENFKAAGIPYSPTIKLKPIYAVTDKYYIATGVNNDGTFKYEEYKSFRDKDGKYTVPEVPAMEGFTVKGWTLDGAAVTPDGTFAANSRKFYADYELNKYKAVYKVDGVVYAEYEIPFASEVTKPADPTKPADENGEFIFSGWTPQVPATMPAKDLEFNGSFTQKGNDYVVKFVDGERVISAQTLKAGDPIVLPEEPQRFGYKFTGWTPDVPATMPAEDLTFTATWETDTQFLALVIGGAVVAGGVVATVSAANAALITGAAIVGGIALIGGTVYIAKNTYTVCYIVDGAEYKTYKVLAGTKIPVPADPTKDGSEFAGWTPDIPDVMPENDLTFEATWCGENDREPAQVDNDIPNTGSATAGVAAFAVISASAAAAYVITKKKRED